MKEARLKYIGKVVSLPKKVKEKIYKNNKLYMMKSRETFSIYF